METIAKCSGPVCRRDERKEQAQQRSHYDISAPSVMAQQWYRFRILQQEKHFCVHLELLY